MNLKDRKERHIRGSGGRRGKGKVIKNIIIISKILKALQTDPPVSEQSNFRVSTLRK